MNTPGDSELNLRLIQNSDLIIIIDNNFDEWKYIINAPHARQTNVPQTTRDWRTILHIAECNYATTKNNSSSNIPVEKVMSDDDTNNNIFMNGMM